MTCSMTACSRCSASTSVISSTRLVIRQKWRQSGHSSACAPTSRVRLTISLRCRRGRSRRSAPRLRRGSRSVCQASSSIASTAARTRFDHPHPDRVLPAGLLQPLEHLGVPESRVGAEQLDAGRAGTLDPGDQLVAEALLPFWVFAEPFRSRMCSASRVSARVAFVARRPVQGTPGRHPHRPHAPVRRGHEPLSTPPGARPSCRGGTLTRKRRRRVGAGAQMAKAILGLARTPTPTEAADELALAVCHAGASALLRLAGQALGLTTPAEPASEVSATHKLHPGRRLRSST